MSNTYEDAFQAIEKINQILATFRSQYPDVKQKEALKIDTDNRAFNILKATERIIKNYNPSNAERKLKSLLALFGKEIIR